MRKRRIIFWNFQFCSSTTVVSSVWRGEELAEDMAEEVDEELVEEAFAEFSWIKKGELANELTKKVNVWLSTKITWSRYFCFNSTWRTMAVTTWLLDTLFDWFADDLDEDLSVSSSFGFLHIGWFCLRNLLAPDSIPSSLSSISISVSVSWFST